MFESCQTVMVCIAFITPPPLVIITATMLASLSDECAANCEFCPSLIKAEQSLGHPKLVNYYPCNKTDRLGSALPRGPSRLAGQLSAEDCNLVGRLLYMRFTSFELCSFQIH